MLFDLITDPVQPWFEPQTFGAMYGAIGGGGAGVLGGLLGACAGYYAPRGKGRAWIMPGFVLVIGLGLLSAAFGLIAAACDQPFAIWFFPVQIGSLLTLVFTGLCVVIRKRYAQAELRRAAAVDPSGLADSKRQ